VAATLNKVMLMGTVCRQPESFSSQNGTVVASFRLAVGRGKKNPQTGQWENADDQLYIDCKCFFKDGYRRNLPDVVARFVSVGTNVFLEGRLQEETWEDKNGGGKRSKMVVVFDSMELLGSKSAEGGEHHDNRPPARQSAAPTAAAGPDDFPF